jgi:hypothetical protein
MTFLSTHNLFFQLRDCELGAIVNRDLSRRIRTVNGITSHRQVVRHDIKLSARIVHNLDAKAGLWVDPDSPGAKGDSASEGDPKKMKEKEPDQLSLPVSPNYIIIIEIINKACTLQKIQVWLNLPLADLNIFDTDLIIIVLSYVDLLWLVEERIFPFCYNFKI